MSFALFFKLLVFLSFSFIRSLQQIICFHFTFFLSSSVTPILFMSSFIKSINPLCSLPFFLSAAPSSTSFSQIIHHLSCTHPNHLYLASLTLSPNHWTWLSLWCPHFQSSSFWSLPIKISHHIKSLYCLINLPFHFCCFLFHS